MASLRNKIPVGTKFNKLGNGGEPYRCAEWKCDQEGRFCLYYQFNGHKKRLPEKEIESAVAQFELSGRFDREMFKTLCPIAARDGGCGFAVIVRIIEKFCDAKYLGDGVVIRNAAAE